jgi:transposase
MFVVESYAAVRRFVFLEGHSRREAARVFGLSRDTIAKMCRYSAPPGYVRRRPAAKPKLGLLVPVIEAILEADRSAPAKQQHTAKRIFERLRDEHGYDGGYTVVKDHVRRQRARGREVFVPLAHPPGHAQVDFGEAVAVIGGVQQKVHFFCLDLPQSDACFVKAYPRETTEAFLDGHVSAFAFFGGVPRSILYDNLKLAVARICGDGRRERTRAFTGLVSHYLFQDRFGRPGKGNDKGKVEGLVKFARAKFLTPVPIVASYEALNAMLAERCRERQSDRSGRHAETISERLTADLAALQHLPEVALEPCEIVSARVSSTALVRYRGNDYSVPTAHGFQAVLVKGFVDAVLILCDGVPVARHARSYGHREFVYDPLHYLALLETKPGALDQAAALQGWALPPAFQHLRHLLEARMGNRGKREFIQVLRLLEIAAKEVVAAAVTEAIQFGAIGFDAVRQIVLARIERRPARLDLAAYPWLLNTAVRSTRAADYAVLLEEQAA